jgi:hypothetical protein
MLNAETLRTLLSYEPETGLFTWKHKRKRVFQGDIAGATHKSGYIVIGCQGKIWPAHRLAWLYMTGRLPPSFIDHIDGNKTNNRWRNLRLASRSENSRNRGAQKNNKSGFKGVSWDSSNQKWRAIIYVDGKKIALGRFSCPVAAHQAYSEAAESFHGQFKNAGQSR